MFSKTVSYTDFNGNARNETLYFHMMVPDFTDLQFNPIFEGGFSDYIANAMSSGDGQKIYTFFKLMMVNSYGRRSADGSEFEKNPAWTERFLNSLAYEEFFMWLVSNPKNAEEFWNGIMPAKLLEKANEMESLSGKKKLQDMSKEELLALWQKTEQEQGRMKEIAANM